MSFLENSNQFMVFLWFFVLGVKYGVEQKLFNLTKNILTNKIANIFCLILNVLFVVINCSQFYFLALKTNFGWIRPFMFLAFFGGFCTIFILIQTLLHVKVFKKNKKRQIDN